MGSTKIEWADAVWNPVTGCTPVSAGCANCYAERLVKRFGPQLHGAVFDRQDMVPIEAFPFFTVLLHQDRLDQPLHWRKPRRVFVSSMGDLFHEDVPEEFIASIFSVMTSCGASKVGGPDGHTFMVLTKRPERMLRYVTSGLHRSNFHDFSGVMAPLHPAIWLGVSVENQVTADERIPLLLQTPAAVRFVSVEPMLGPVDLRGWTTKPQWGEVNDRGTRPYEIVGRGDLLNWVICGGESGPGARPMHPEWARSLRDQCNAAGVPFFFKQWGEWAPNCLCPGDTAHRTIKRPEPGKPGVMFRCGKKSAGRLLDGREWNEFPATGMDGR